MITINRSTNNNNKRVSNTLNKTNKYPYILHKNIKNYRNKNRYTNCSSFYDPCDNNKLSEKIYRGLDFQRENGNTCDINENYKIVKAKNRTTSGIQTPKCFTDCTNNIILVNNNSRINCINTKINPYIQEYNKYKINNNKYNVHVKTNANNYRYSNYSNYLKKKRSCIKK